jgi:hypothetical protein
MRKARYKAHGAQHLRHIIEIGESASTAQGSRWLSAVVFNSLLGYQVTDEGIYLFRWLGIDEKLVQFRE